MNAQGQRRRESIAQISLLGFPSTSTRQSACSVLRAASASRSASRRYTIRAAAKVRCRFSRPRSLNWRVRTIFRRSALEVIGADTHWPKLKMVMRKFVEDQSAKAGRVADFMAYFYSRFVFGPKDGMRMTAAGAGRPSPFWRRNFTCSIGCTHFPTNTQDTVCTW